MSERDFHKYLIWALNNGEPATGRHWYEQQGKSLVEFIEVGCHVPANPEFNVPGDLLHNPRTVIVSVTTWA